MMRSLVCTALGLCAVTALAGGFPTADDVREDAVARHVVDVNDPGALPVGGLSADGTCFGGGRAEVLRMSPSLATDDPFVRDDAFVCHGLGTYWIRREDGRLARPIAAWYGPVPLHGLAGREGLSRRIVADLGRRGATFPPVGTDTPVPGPQGELPPALADGGVLVALDVGPADSADMFEDTARIDAESFLYWAHRTGGFAGVDLWLGPFPVPLVRDLPPSEVVPPRIRVRKHARRRALTIRREIDASAGATVRRRDYAPTDLDLGAGIDVLRVLRANVHSIRVRVRVAPDAPTGPRDVSVNGRTGEALLALK